MKSTKVYIVIGSNNMLSQSFLDTINRYIVVLDQEDKHIRDFECVVGFGKELSEVLFDCFVDCVNALIEDSQFVPESYKYDSIRYDDEFNEFPRLQLHGRYYVSLYNSTANCGKLLMLLSKNMPNIRFTMKDIDLKGYSLQHGLYSNYPIPSSQLYVDISIDEQRFPQLVKTIISKFEKFKLAKPFQKFLLN